IENNGYSMGTSQARSSAYKNCLAYRADGYNIVWDLIEGWDICEVRARIHAAMERARNESRPTVVEVVTYRYLGHSVSDGNAKVFGTPEEIHRCQDDHDPIRLWKTRLLDDGVLTDDQYRTIDRAAKDEAEQSSVFAAESPYPDESAITSDVYREVDDFTE